MAKKNRQRKQEQMFPEESDPYIVKVADRVVELKTEKKRTDDKLEVEAKNLLGLMKKAGKPKIRHGGMIFELKETPGKETLKMKEEKAKKSNQ